MQPYIKIFLIILMTGFSSCLGARISKDIHVFDSATVIRSADYVVLGRGYGQDSAFYILGAIPVTKEPNVELALSQVLEKFPEGRTLINIQIQQEDKPYFPLGLVTVVKVSADVIGDIKQPVDANSGKKKAGK